MKKIIIAWLPFFVGGILGSYFYDFAKLYRDGSFKPNHFENIILSFIVSSIISYFYTKKYGFNN